MTQEGLARFRKMWLGRGYVPASCGAEKAFRDPETGVRIEVVTTGESPGDGLPKAVAFPDPATPGLVDEIDGFRVIALQPLVELKLASGTTAPHRLRDLADVQDLIVRLALPLSLADRLDPSVQAAYRDFWNRSHEGER